ncbi:hypothetical protein [Lactococcus lactis]
MVLVIFSLTFWNQSFMQFQEIFF